VGALRQKVDVLFAQNGAERVRIGQKGSVVGRGVFPFQPVHGTILRGREPSLEKTVGVDPIRFDAFSTGHLHPEALGVRADHTSHPSSPATPLGGVQPKKGKRVRMGGVEDLSDLVHRQGLPEGRLGLTHAKP